MLLKKYAIYNHEESHLRVFPKDNFSIDQAQAYDDIIDFLNDFKIYVPCDYDGKDLEFEFVGVCTDICVISNVFAIRQAFPEAEITVDASCCAGTTPKKHEAALQVMESCQVNVINWERV